VPKRSNAVLAVGAAAEAATGLVLMADPEIVIRLLFGTQPAGLVEVVSRLAGVALVALGAACWPWRGRAHDPALFAMTGYSSGAAVYFAALRIGHSWVGPLLVPATLYHVLLSVLLVRERLRSAAPLEAQR
jgi:hypothetical protein